MKNLYFRSPDINFREIFFVVFLLLISSNFFCDQIQFESITINFAEKDLDFARKIIKDISVDIENFQRKIGLYPDIPVKLNLASSREEYKKWTNNNVKILEFSEAFFYKRNKTIYIRNPLDLKNYRRLRRILIHEYIHLFINHYYANTPLWFHEGMAVYFSNELSYQREYSFVINYILGNSLSLNEMKNEYPENRIEWESFYAKSALAIKYIYTIRRNEFYDFWDNAQPYSDFNTNFLKSFFVTQNDFSAIFEEYCKVHFRAEILLASTSIFWGFLPLIFIIGLIRRKIRERRMKREWEQENVLEE